MGFLIRVRNDSQTHQCSSIRFLGDEKAGEVLAAGPSIPAGDLTAVGALGGIPDLLVPPPPPSQY